MTATQAAANGTATSTTRLSDDAHQFVALSVLLTGFPRYDLYATGMAQTYLDTVRAQIGAEQYDGFVAAVGQVGHPGLVVDPTQLEIACAVTYMWYTGAWPRLAPAAHAALRRQVANVEFVVSPEAYTEGLVWRTFGGHPSGAKPPGYATWALAPPALRSIDDMLDEIVRDETDRDDVVRAEQSFDADLVAEQPHLFLPGPGWAWFTDPSGPDIAQAPERRDTREATR